MNRKIDLQEEFSKIATDGIVSEDERLTLVKLIEAYQDGIDKERVKAEDERLRIIKSAIVLVIGIMLSMYGWMIFVFIDLSIPVDDILWKILGMSFGLVNTMIVLRIKGWLKTEELGFLNSIGTFLRNVFGLAGKNVPDLPFDPDQIPDIAKKDENVEPKIKVTAEPVDRPKAVVEDPIIKKRVIRKDEETEDT